MGLCRGMQSFGEDCALPVGDKEELSWQRGDGKAWMC